MAVHGPRVVAPEAAASTPTHQSPTFDERWAAWEAKGAAHDRAVRRRVTIAAPIALVVIAVILYAFLGQ